jgi:hypothetical protein
MTLGIAVLLFIGTGIAAEAGTKKLHCKFGETFTDGVETNIDTNGDSLSATLGQGAEVCNTGNAVFQEEAEWILQPIPTSACPAGTTYEFHIDTTDPTHPIGQHHVVATDEDTGDQSFAQAISAINCLNFSTFPFTLTGHGQGIITGGTGKYIGATGTYTSQWSGTYLAAGCKGGCPAGPFGGFGQVSGTSDGTLTLPHAGDGKDGHGQSGQGKDD